MTAAVSLNNWLLKSERPSQSPQPNAVLGPSGCPGLGLSQLQEVIICTLIGSNAHFLPPSEPQPPNRKSQVALPLTQ